MLIQVLLLIAGFILLVKGADWFVDGASAIAEKLKIPQLIIGLTIVAMGTSAPEAAVSISAALKGNADITIGNIVGSNIMNILIILGLSAAIAPIAVEQSTIRRDMPFLLGISLLLIMQGWDGSITRFDGLIMLVLFAAYLIFLLVKARRQPQQDSINAIQRSFWQIPLTVIGLAAIVIGSNMAVDAACAIARLLGISERFIGLTIVALGTSLPELFTSVIAARKGNADIAIGNIIGSNVFNILFVVGLSAVIVPVPFAAAFRFDSVVSIAAAVFLLICCARSSSLKRWHGILMLAGYLAYFMIIL
jgi:cation:H+ antiporter